MPNDAKLGLLCGVGIVITISVVFFRNGSPGSAPAGKATAAAVGSAKELQPPATPGSNRSLKAKPTASEHSPSQLGKGNGGETSR
jgi:hypothetical protein